LPKTELRPEGAKLRLKPFSFLPIPLKSAHGDEKSDMKPPVLARMESSALVDTPGNKQGLPGTTPFPALNPSRPFLTVSAIQNKNL
jgi:hypothetical protein